MCLISFCYANTLITNQREAGITHIVPNIYTRSRSSSSPGEAKHYISTMKPHYHIYFGGLSHKKAVSLKLTAFLFVNRNPKVFIIVYRKCLFSAFFCFFFCRCFFYNRCFLYRSFFYNWSFFSSLFSSFCSFCSF